MWFSFVRMSQLKGNVASSNSTWTTSWGKWPNCFAVRVHFENCPVIFEAQWLGKSLEESRLEVPCMYHFVANQQLLPNAPVLCPLLLNKGACSQSFHRCDCYLRLTARAGSDYRNTASSWHFFTLLVYKVMCQLPLCDQFLKCTVTWISHQKSSSLPTCRI